MNAVVVVIDACSSGGAAYKDEFAMEANAINSLMDNVCENDLFYALPASVTVQLCYKQGLK